MEDFNLSTRSSWQIPAGVSPGTWDYVRAGSIASGYGDFLARDPLTRLDWQIVCRWLPKVNFDAAKPKIIEFGCGNGRTLIPLVQRGYKCIGVDLSMPMLREMENGFKKSFTPARLNPAEVFRNHLTSVHANLVQLDCLRENSVDHAICLFSTLGMIRKQHYRSQFLDHARRIIRPGGKFILHAHNVWSQLRDRGGVSWFASHLIEVARKRHEFGDRLSDYRGIRNMFIHSFRKRELIGLLKRSHFSVQEIYPVTRALLDAIDSCDNSKQAALADAIDRHPKAGPFETIGWIVVCQ